VLKLLRLVPKVPGFGSYLTTEQMHPFFVCLFLGVCVCEVRVEGEGVRWAKLIVGGIF
jgi:hypothetical protein